MDKEIAKKVYVFILKEINGWSDERIEELSYGQIIYDPLFEKLIKL